MTMRLPIDSHTLHFCVTTLGKVFTPVLLTCTMHLHKIKAEHLYSALHGIQTTLKRSGMDHTVLPAINTMHAFTS